MPSSPTSEAPSLFSLVYHSPDGDTIVLNDGQPAKKRKFSFKMNLSKRPSGPIRAESTESLHTIDSTDEPHWTYKASYTPSLADDDMFGPETEDLEPPPEDLTSTASPSKSVTWLKVLQSKLLAVGRALHLCSQ